MELPPAPSPVPISAPAPAPAPVPTFAVVSAASGLSPAMEGAVIPVQINLMTASSVANSVIKLTIQNSAANIVGSQVFSNVSWTANQIKSFTYNFASAEFNNAGTYSVAVDVLSADLSIQYISARNVTSFVLNSSIRVVAASQTNYMDSTGRLWGADSGFAGGTPSRSVPNYAMTKTNDPFLYSGERYGGLNGNLPIGPFSWSATVPNAGKYRVRMKFTEGSAVAPGGRLFNISMNSIPVLQNFDIFVEGGGAQFVAVDREFIVVVDSSKKIQIDFLPGTARDQTISAIEIVGGPM